MNGKGRQAKTRGNANGDWVGANNGSFSSIAAGIKRCAIYTRKSTEEGLDQDFNSLAAQREACEAYVASQRHEGWSLIATAYDDGGYSGGSMHRPGLIALLADIDAGLIDVVVVYKVDRLTRALTDFAKIVDRFDQHAVSFVSVTQSFNTTTSMGRLTLNVLLSFAQFEREVGAERVRDKVAASKKKGLWMGGTVPMGYKAEDRKLMIEPEEAEQVRRIFGLYLTLGSTTALLTELHRLNMRTAKRVSKAGNISGDVYFGTGTILYILKNRTYIGDVVHKGSSYQGIHASILDRKLFDEVQERLSKQAPMTRGRRPKNGQLQHSNLRDPSLLTGLISDSNGNHMSPTHANKGGVRYRYYTSRALAEGRKAEAGHPTRISAPEIEAIVLASIRKHLINQAGDGLSEQDSQSDDLSQSTDAALNDKAIIFQYLQQITVYSDRLRIIMSDNPRDEFRQKPAMMGSFKTIMDDAEPLKLNKSKTITLNPSDETSLHGGLPKTIIVPWKPAQKRPHQRFIEAQTNQAGKADTQTERQRIAHAILTGRGWFAEITSGTSKDINTIAQREDKHVRTIRTTIALSFLSPDIITKLLDQGLPKDWTLSDIGRRSPQLWSKQHEMLGI